MFEFRKDPVLCDWQNICYFSSIDSHLSACLRGRIQHYYLSLTKSNAVQCALVKDDCIASAIETDESPETSIVLGG